MFLEEIGEEAIYLKEKNCDFEIIPGISSSICVPAYAGIPVTHRNIATSFSVITAHEVNEDKDNLKIGKNIKIKNKH